MIDNFHKKLRKFARRRKLSKGQQLSGVETWRDICPRLFGPVEYEARKFLYGQLCENLALDRQDSVTEDFAYYTVHSDTKLMASGKETLTRLLTAVKNTSYYSEEINSEILSSIASILLNEMPEDEVFATVTMLIQSEPHKSCLFTGNVPKPLLYQLDRDKELKKFFTQHSHLSPADILQDWAEWLFLDLPPSLLTCLIDCFLHDGVNCLYRMVNVILRMWFLNRCVLVKLESASDVSREVSSFFSRLNIQPPELLKLTYSQKRKKSKEEKEKNLSNIDETAIDSPPRKDSQKSESSLEPDFYDEISQQPSCFLNTSAILNENQMAELYLRVPIRYQLHEVKRQFSTYCHGTSMRNFWNLTEHVSPSIIIIQTTKAEVFGAFCTQAWQERRKHKKMRYFGTGESFVFKFSAGSLFVYNWVGLEPTSCKPGQELFQAADDETLIIGGGAIAIRQCLQKGSTEASSTYLNPPLAANRDFEIQNLEMFGFC